MQELQLPAEERLLPKVHVNLGITLEADGCLSAACDHYRCVLPLLARIRGVLLTCMHAIKCVACTTCREAARLEPSHYRARKLLGSALYALGDLHAARTALSDALALRPDYADAHCDMGEAQGSNTLVTCSC